MTERHEVVKTLRQKLRWVKTTGRQINALPTAPRSRLGGGSSCRAGGTDPVRKMPPLPAALVKDKLREMENKVRVRGGFHVST